jgi:hypothetical protein
MEEGYTPLPAATGRRVGQRPTPESGAGRYGARTGVGIVRRIEPTNEEQTMSIGTILLIILILILIGALPSWPYSRAWGYYPSGIVGIIVVVLIVLLVMGRL